jgi:hypothetical protein
MVRKLYDREHSASTPKLPPTQAQESTGTVTVTVEEPGSASERIEQLLLEKRRKLDHLGEEYAQCVLDIQQVLDSRSAEKPRTVASTISEVLPRRTITRSPIRSEAGRGKTPKRFRWEPRTRSKDGGVDSKVDAEREMPRVVPPSPGKRARVVPPSPEKETVMPSITSGDKEVTGEQEESYLIMDEWTMRSRDIRTDVPRHVYHC